MITAISTFSLSGGNSLKTTDMSSVRSATFLTTPQVTLPTKTNRTGTSRNLCVRAEYREQRFGGGDFVAGFLIGGAIFGPLVYKYAPQIRRTLQNENEHGFKRARKPVYYNDEPELSQTLNEKIGQLNSVIEKVASRLRRNKIPKKPIEVDPEEATA